jgi:hypothetical protein
MPGSFFREVGTDFLTYSDKLMAANPDTVALNENVMLDQCL